MWAFFFFLVPLHKKVLIIYRDFSLPCQSVNDGGAWIFFIFYLYFSPLRSMIAWSSCESTRGKVNLLAVMTVRLLLVWVTHVLCGK